VQIRKKTQSKKEESKDPMGVKAMNGKAIIIRNENPEE
jgi:hypothetical protein